MNNRYKILVVEDEENIRSFVTALLEAGGYQVIQAPTCTAAKTLYSSYMPDLVILDLGLPDLDGLNLLRFVREGTATPVIVLSARTEEKDKVEALDLGANDYITKPFGSAELQARVRSALRNTRGAGQVPGVRFIMNGLEIDYDARRVTIDGKEIHLTQTEYNIVSLLSEHCGKVMTYASIIKAIWGYPDTGSTKKLQVNMANIRKKFGATPGQVRFIKNELGVGYRMESDE